MVKAREIPGFMIENKNCPVKFSDTREFRNGIEHGYDLAIKKQSEVELGAVIDREELAIVLFNRGKKYFTYAEKGWGDLDKISPFIKKAWLIQADEIIAANLVKIRVKK